MKQTNAHAPIPGRQMSLVFEPRKLDGMSDAERLKAAVALAQIFMQAAGLVVEELGNE